MEIINCKSLNKDITIGRAGIEILINSDIDIDDISRNRNNIRGLLCEEKDILSHTVIFLKLLGAIIFVIDSEDIAKIKKEDILLLDGVRDLIIINPDQTTLNLYRRKMPKLSDNSIYEGKVTTKDGIKIHLHGSALTLNDIDLFTNKYKMDIGLWRSEGILLDNDRDYIDIYCKAYDINENIIFRLFDTTGDKAVLFNKINTEGLIDEQIGHLMGISDLKELKILIPNVESEEDIIKIKEKIRRRNISCSIGAMMETSSSVILCDDIIKHCDFVHIGLNGLFRQLNHPKAVLKSAQRIVSFSRKMGLQVYACGEKLCDKEYLRLLLGIGISDFCVSRHDIGTIVNAIKTINYGEAIRDSVLYIGKYYIS